MAALRKVARREEEEEAERPRCREEDEKAAEAAGVLRLVPEEEEAEVEVVVRDLKSAVRVRHEQEEEEEGGEVQPRSPSKAEGAVSSRSGAAVLRRSETVVQVAGPVSTRRTGQQAAVGALVVASREEAREVGARPPAVLAAGAEGPSDAQRWMKSEAPPQQDLRCLGQSCG